MITSLELSHIELRVPDLARSLDFYTRQVGLVVTGESSTSVDLGVDGRTESLLRLQAEPTARQAAADAAGLFHAALLLSTRGALGAWLRGAAERGIQFDGFSDHGVSEAIYFHDPDGNGLEFYADRPPAEWPMAGEQVAMVTRPLDLPSLLSEPHLGSPFGGARWGHLHLRVTDLDRSEAFYHDALGLAVTQRNYPGARFMAADGYHHHLGLNVWGTPRKPQPPLAFGLAAATFRSNRTEAPRELRDPDGILLRVRPL